MGLSFLGIIGFLLISNIFKKNIQTNSIKIEEFGIELEFLDGYTKNKGDDGKWYVNFGPLNPSLSPIPTDELTHIYSMYTVKKRTTDEIIKELKKETPYGGTLLLDEPKIKKINKLDIVEWTEGGTCENRTMEIVGQEVNYIFSSLGCFTDQEFDFDYFEKTITTIKFL